MKKILINLRGMLLLVAVVFGMSAVAQTLSSDGEYLYTLDADGNATITKYLGEIGVIAIPASLDGHTVTTIGNYKVGNSTHGSFSGLTTEGSSVKIIIPETVTSISTYAFANNTISALTIASPTLEIKNRAFWGCRITAIFTAAESITFGKNCFGYADYVYDEDLDEEIQINVPCSASYLYATTPAAANALTATVNGSQFVEPFVTVNNLGTVKTEMTIQDVYGTYYNSQAFVMPAGVTGTIVSGVESGKLKFETRFAEGDVVPAGTGLLISDGATGAKTPASYTSYLTTNVSKLAGNNMLSGTDVKQDVPAEPGYLFYVLTYSTKGEIGFYYQPGTGGEYIKNNGAHRAYMRLPKATVGKEVRGFSFATDVMEVEFDGESLAYDDSSFEGGGITTTGIEQLNGEKSDAVIFDMNGRRLTAPQKGLNVINGKKVFVK